MTELTTTLVNPFGFLAILFIMLATVVSMLLIKKGIIFKEDKK